MKKKVTYFLLGSFLILIVICYIFSSYLSRQFRIKLEGQERVIINDILKNSQAYLENGSDEILKKSLENHVELVLYDLQGKVIYDSRNNTKPGSNEDINKILAYENKYSQVYVVSYVKSKMQQTAIALIKNTSQLYESEKQEDRFHHAISLFFTICSLFLTIIFLMIYFNILRPFHKLEYLALQVAKGNLDYSLVYPRHNFFGAFTWSFDMLRNELKSSKLRAEEAERTKKELVAVLSHDIRTPIASMKAYSECLLGLEDKNSARSERYVNVILQKADELTKLTQDLFLHAISDLEQLEVNPTICNGRELINKIMEPLILSDRNRIIITSTIPDVYVIADRKRLAQVYENILQNSFKYAKGSEIRIETAVEDGTLLCKIIDFGKGVLPEDIPFLFDKFYRGKNAKESNEEGSGLGLYICKYILEKLEGNIKAYNRVEDGLNQFIVELSLKIVY